MNKRRMLAAAVVAAVFATPGPALAYHGAPMYNWTWYSDGTYQVEVGWARDACYWWGVGGYPPEGEQTAYVQPTLVGYCYDGYEEPL